MSGNGNLKRVLVVDDDPQITEVLRFALTTNGYDVQSASDGVRGLELSRRWQPELVITDLSMPKLGGIALCQAIRGFSDAPIIVLSVKGQEAIKIHALECGADDYVTKPFGSGELLARAAAALRRASIDSHRKESINEGDFLVDLTAHRVEIRGREVYLTPKEFELLAYLLGNAHRVLTHKDLLNRLWGKAYADQSDSVRVLVRHLRKKIEINPSNPKYLKTEPWIGYRFEPTV